MPFCVVIGVLGNHVARMRALFSNLPSSTFLCGQPVTKLLICV